MMNTAPQQPPDRGPVLASLVDGGSMSLLYLSDVRLLRSALRLLGTELGRRDGAVPANVAVLAALLDRVAAAAAVAARLPSAAVRGSDGSAWTVPPVNVDRMNLRDVARALGCGERNVRDLVSRGALPAHKAGGRWLVDPLDLDDLLQSRRAS